MSETQYTTNRIATILSKLGNTEEGVDVYLQPQTDPVFRYFLMEDLQTGITLTSPALKDSSIINVAAGHGFTATGEYLVIREGDAFEQLAVTGVSTNAISVEMPVARTYAVETSLVTRGNIQMNVDGSSTPRKFHCRLTSAVGTATPVNIKAAIITMAHGANVPDDGRFGGLVATGFNGLHFRKENGFYYNLGNYKNNQEFRTIGADVNYTQKAPAGTYGTIITIPLEGTFGKVLQLDPRINDSVAGYVRDDLSPTAGMASMITTVLGSYTTFLPPYTDV